MAVFSTRSTHPVLLHGVLEDFRAGDSHLPGQRRQGIHEDHRHDPWPAGLERRRGRIRISDRKTTAVGVERLVAGLLVGPDPESMSYLQLFFGNAAVPTCLGPAYELLHCLFSW